MLAVTQTPDYPKINIFVGVEATGDMADSKRSRQNSPVTQSGQVLRKCKP